MLKEFFSRTGILLRSKLNNSDKKCFHENQLKSIKVTGTRMKQFLTIFALIYCFTNICNIKKHKLLTFLSFSF